MLNGYSQRLNISKKKKTFLDTSVVLLSVTLALVIKTMPLNKYKKLGVGGSTLIWRLNVKLLKFKTIFKKR